MGFLSKITKIALPATIGFATGGPAGAFAGAVGGSQAEKAERKQKRLIEQRQREEQKIMSEIFGSNSTGLSQLQSAINPRTVTTNQAGFGSGFGSFLSDVGSNILSPLTSIFSQVRPFISNQSIGQPALPTLTNAGGQESSRSGTTEAFVGGIPNIIGTASRFLRTPAGSIGTGLLTGIGGSMIGGGSGGMRITRKMKSQYRAVLNLAQGDYDQAASMIGVSTDQFIMVLLKRFRNDGPVVTKAALRKTKTTVRRLKSMCDMYDSLRPTATRRKAPMRRASTTLISNK